MLILFVTVNVRAQDIFRGIVINSDTQSYTVTIKSDVTYTIDIDDILYVRTTIWKEIRLFYM